MLRFVKLAIILSFVFLLSCKTVKVIESSSKQKPRWLHGIDKNYLVGEGTGGNFNEAKENAILMVRKKIAASIAQKIYIEENHALEETRKDNDFTLIEQFTSKIISKTNNLSYLQGISISQADDFYWERKKKKRNNYIHYYIKYPFSRNDLQELIDLWKENESRMTERLYEVIQKSENLVSLEEMVETMNELEYLSDFFMDDRKADALIGIKNLQNKIENINILPLVDSLGFYSYNLKSGEYYITTQYTPVITSNCAILKKINTMNFYNSIVYDYEHCNVKNDNYIDIGYDANGTTFGKRVYFDVSLKKIYIENPSSITFKTIDKKYFRNERIIECYFTVNSLSPVPFKIERIELNLKHQKIRNGKIRSIKKLPSILSDNSGLAFSGKGSKSVKFRYVIRMTKSGSYSSKKHDKNLASGKIIYSSPVSGEKKVLLFKDVEFYTDW